ncbi:MAG: hypothetical protein WC764_01830 [Candidatus Paceibacterota bacterium]
MIGGKGREEMKFLTRGVFLKVEELVHALRAKSTLEVHTMRWHLFVYLGAGEAEKFGITRPENTATDLKVARDWTEATLKRLSALTGSCFFEEQLSLLERPLPQTASKVSDEFEEITG